MSILGLGNDIVNIKRIEKIIKNNKKNFLLKILHKDEKKFKKLTANIIAKKFAAKEAFAKALGTGIGKYIQFKEICINYTKNGAPKIKFDKLHKPNHLEHITNIFFNQRRKMIKKPMKQLFVNFEKIASELNIDLNLRPQNIPLKKYLEICKIYEKLMQ